MQETPSESQQIPTMANNTTIAINIAKAPALAFKQIQQRYAFAFPLVALILVNSIVAIYFWSKVDFGWFIEHTAAGLSDDLSPAEIDQQRQGLELLGQKGWMVASVITEVIIYPLMFSLLSIYLVIVSNIRDDGFQFKQWFSFCAWSALPGLASTLASALVIAFNSDGQLSPESINPLSLNALFFQQSVLSGSGAIWASIDLPLLWTLVIMIIGYTEWTKSSRGVSSMVILLPFVVYFGSRLLMV